MLANISLNKSCFYEVCQIMADNLKLPGLNYGSLLLYSYRCCQTWSFLHWKTVWAVVSEAIKSSNELY